MAGIRVRTMTGVVAVAAVLGLAGCANSAPAPSPTATSATPSPATSERVTPTPIETERTTSTTLPTDCAELGQSATRDEAVGDMTLQSDGEGFIRPAPQGATLALGCDWIVGDTTGMLLLISTADPAAVTAAADELPADGYTCGVSDDFGATFCRLEGDTPDTEELIVARDDVWIYLSTVDRNGRAFLSDIAASIFS